MEIVFGPGATLLSKELAGISDKNEELSDTEVNSDSEIEDLNGSTPPKDQRKKRVRNIIKSGDESSIKEGEHSEEVSKEVKKPRLGESGETRKEIYLQGKILIFPRNLQKGKWGNKITVRG